MGVLQWDFFQIVRIFCHDLTDMSCPRLTPLVMTHQYISIIHNYHKNGILILSLETITMKTQLRTTSNMALDITVFRTSISYTSTTIIA